MNTSYSLWDRAFDAGATAFASAGIAVVIAFFMMSFPSLEDLLFLKHFFYIAASIGAVFGFFGEKRLIEDAIETMVRGEFHLFSPLSWLVFIAIGIFIIWAKNGHHT